MEIKANQFYAHTPPKAGGDWHLLSDHLRAVSEITEQNTAKFAGEGLGRALGALHDIGKANPDFQRYLRQCCEAEVSGGRQPRGTPHSIYGAVIANANGSPLLAFPAAGHHGGLKDTSSLKSAILDAQAADWLTRAESLFPADVSNCAVPDWTSNPCACEFLIRMLFSALVDADWLDTEAHFQQARSQMRGNAITLEELWQRFEEDQSRIPAPTTPVNIARNEIYQACLEAADGGQGVYRLTVPTGGGKTRSGMAFALRHGMRHGLDRVIFAIPYTSIIDQTADVYRGIFGDDCVLEHHSAIEVQGEGEYESESEMRRQLAAENWDAPIVVTTTVQLFESLFANKPSRCRKLHNIARSVVVLDEVQTLPLHLVQPILDVLNELVAHYGVTIVLSTATQPAFSGDSPYLKGFPETREIVPDPGRYFQALKRVEYELPAEEWSWGRVAEEMREADQALCVVNSRADALTLFSELADPEALHLSTLMCPAHRRETLAEIRERLASGVPCRVVSTQVVEAGVDLDFPLVLRAMGPLDRIVQAAGRCNREGRMDSAGRVVVFRPADGRAPRGIYATALAEAGQMLSQSGCDLHSPQVFDSYFGRLWPNINVDAQGITGFRKRLDFPEVAGRFRMIDEPTVPVLVLYGDPGPAPVLESIRQASCASRTDWRRLQPYMISMYKWTFDQYDRDNLIERPIDGLHVWKGQYDPLTGIIGGMRDPADLVS